MALRTVNLNLLPMLNALLTERSVTGAALTLGISQSAMSDALARLRATFDDPLLVRAGRRMALSPLAVDLVSKVNGVNADLAALFTKAEFDPKSSTREFVIASPDFGAWLVARDWLDRLALLAPRIRLRFVAIDEHLPSRLAKCELDFAILPEAILHQTPPPPLELLPFARLSLGADASVALFRAEHPLDGRHAVDLEAIKQFRLLAFHPGLDAVERRYHELFFGGEQIKPVLRIQELALLPFLLLGSDDVAIVPQRLADAAAAHLALRSAALDFRTKELAVALAWSQAQAADPSHRWFREQIVRGG